MVPERTIMQRKRSPMNKYDPKTARDMFVVQKQGINAIARFFGVSPSSISERSRKEDWKGQQIAYESAIARRSYESMAAGVADERSQIAQENILAARATVRKYLADLSTGKVQVTARDAELMMRFLVGELAPADGLNHDAPSMKDVTPPDADFLKEIIRASRTKVAAPVQGEGTKLN
jgi:hypothetical protein